MELPSKVSELNPDHKIKTLTQALEVLNNAAEDSSEEIGKMLKTDYKKLKNVMAGITSEAKGAFGNFKASTEESISDIKKKVVDKTNDLAQDVDKSVSQHPWYYMGGAAVTSALIGFLLGRKSKS